MSHTPGPWKVWGEKLSPDAHVAKVGTAYVVADYVCGYAEDDARLIAAAPDLLAACEVALERPETRCKCETDDCANHRAREMLRNAIAKVRGEAE